MLEGLKNQRLLIRSLIGNDAEKISKYRSDPIVAEFQSWDEYSVKQAQTLIEEMKNSSPTDKGSIDPKNQRSQNLLKKLGFEVLETLPPDTIFVKLLG